MTSRNIPQKNALRINSIYDDSFSAWITNLLTDSEDLLAVLVTEGGQGVGEEGERYGCDEAHQVFTLRVLQLATEAGPLQEGDHLGQGVLLCAGDTNCREYQTNLLT